MNAGTAQGTLSACFVLPIVDSMEGIMKAATDAAMVQKFGGGTGFSLSKIRPKDAPISTTHGKACGPIEVLKTLSRVSSMITQGGKRDGANMAVMSVYHPDILEFIDCKRVEGDIHNFNISVGVDSAFMQCVRDNSSYSLLNPHNGLIAGELDAKTVFLKIIEGAWSNGEPGVVFLDTINKDNKVSKVFGDITATNPCGEQPLLDYESCNLGSINLAKFYDEEENSIDWERLRYTVHLAVRFLDNVVDANDYAVPAIKEMTQATRKIGLGVMGFADLLIQLGIPYDTEEGISLGSNLMKFINDSSNIASLALGAIRGEFPAWQESDYLVHENYRNACRLTVAPTGTISMLADTSNGIEPIFALVWKKQNILEGKSLYFVNKYFERDAQEFEFYSEDLMDYLAEGGSLQDRDDVPDIFKELYVTSEDISHEYHVKMQSAFQEYCDSGISKTINLSSEASKEDVYSAYMLAWESGCKGITVYRSGSRQQEVLVSGHAPAPQYKCCNSPFIIMTDGCETCKRCGWSACAVA
jgi:ribonucleoside-diphosphate reductase alpha chain